MDCAQPLRVVCGDCGHQTFWRCDCSSEAKCPDCAERRRRLIARLVDLGTTDRLGSGYTYFLTLSAPGENDHRRWRQGKGGNDRPPCDCHHVWQHQHRGDWNKQESSHWNRLRTALSRLSQGSLTYIGSVEVQERGMLHRHLVVNLDRPVTPEEVGSLALAAGYGCVHDLQPILSAAKAAWYISKYVTKSSGDRENVHWRSDLLVQRCNGCGREALSANGAPASCETTTASGRACQGVLTVTGEVRTAETVPTFRTWSSAQSWGYTLKGLRDIARVQAQARARYLRDLHELVAADHAASRSAAGPALADSSDPPPG